MTETEWLQSTDFQPMMGLLLHRVSERKRRLLACGCCRLIWPALADERSRAAVAASEGYADGRVTRGELEHAYRGAGQAWEECTARFWEYRREKTFYYPLPPEYVAL